MLRIPLMSCVLLILLTACASPGRPSLVGQLPEEEPDSIRFFHGSWIWPDSIYAFHLTSGTLYVADRSDDPPRDYRVDAETCPGLAAAYGGMQTALASTARIAAGEIAVAKPSEIILDGPSYRIELWSRSAASTIEIRGGSNSQLVTPWVDAALAVRTLGEQCHGA